MRRWLPLVLLAALPIVGGTGYAGGSWAALRGQDERTLSQEAAARACERPYVRPTTTRPPGLRPVALTRVAVVEQPSAMAFPPRGGPGVLGERTGRVLAFDGRTVGDMVLDFTGDTLTSGDGGLLALAYAPDGEWLYVFRTRADNTDVIAAYPVGQGGPDRRRQRVIMEIDHPSSKQHHGGGLAFGPDGLLYIGTGDGGGPGDPRGNAQRMGSLLGKLLRIDPMPGSDPPYRVPEGNPFVAVPGARPEIFSYGLRNPYRIGFDGATGDLWIADVGQSCWEELNWRPGGGQGGENFEWDRREGTHRFQGGHPPDGVEPVLSWAHADGWCAIVGGFPYHGEALPALDGWYLLTDYCHGEVYAARHRPGAAPETVALGVGVREPFALVPGPDGEPYLLGGRGTVYRVTALPGFLRRQPDS